MAGYKGKKYNVQVFVADGETVNNLLSLKTAVEMGLVESRVERVYEKPKEMTVMDTDPVKIYFKEGAYTAHRLPIPLFPKVKAVERVTKLTGWCAPMVPVIKPSRAVRICVGLNRLNKNIKRERNMIPTVDET